MSVSVYRTAEITKTYNGMQLKKPPLYSEFQAEGTSAWLCKLYFKEGASSWAGGGWSQLQKCVAVAEIWTDTLKMAN